MSSTNIHHLILTQKRGGGSCGNFGICNLIGFHIQYIAVLTRTIMLIHSLIDCKSHISEKLLLLPAKKKTNFFFFFFIKEGRVIYMLRCLGDIHEWYSVINIWVTLGNGWYFAFIKWSFLWQWVYTQMWFDITPDGLGDHLRWKDKPGIIARQVPYLLYYCSGLKEFL